MLKKLGLTFLILSIIPFLLYWMKAEGLAGVSVGDFLSQGSIVMLTVVANEEIKWVEPPKVVKPVKVTPKVVKHEEKAKEVKIDISFDIDKLAKAVALHETAGCTKGNSAKKNNCFGIMQWDKKGRRSFKSYKTKEDSYKDFKRIWEKHYKGMPNLAKAKKYSGNDRANIWLKNVLQFYHS